MSRPDSTTRVRRSSSTCSGKAEGEVSWDDAVANGSAGGALAQAVQPAAHHQHMDVGGGRRIQRRYRGLPGPVHIAVLLLLLQRGGASGAGGVGSGERREAAAERRRAGLRHHVGPCPPPQTRPECLHGRSARPAGPPSAPGGGTRRRVDLPPQRASPHTCCCCCRAAASG